MELFTITEIVILALLTGYLLHRYADRKTNFWIKMVVFFSWFLSFILHIEVIVNMLNDLRRNLDGWILVIELEQEVIFLKFWVFFRILILFIATFFFSFLFLLLSYSFLEGLLGLFKFFIPSFTSVSFFIHSFLSFFS